MTVFPLLLTALVSPASAFTEPMSGLYAETAASTAVLDIPSVGWRGSVGGTFATGLWLGQYDDVYALGKFLSLGAVVSMVGHQEGALLIPQFEVRRGWDILLTQVGTSLRVGPVTSLSPLETPTRWGVSLGGQVKYRYHRYWGAILTLHGGVVTKDETFDAFQPTFASSLGIGWSAPFHAPD